MTSSSNNQDARNSGIKAENEAIIKATALVLFAEYIAPALTRAYAEERRFSPSPANAGQPTQPVFLLSDFLNDDTFEQLARIAHKQDGWDGIALLIKPLSLARITHVIADPVTALIEIAIAALKQSRGRERQRAKSESLEFVTSRVSPDNREREQYSQLIGRAIDGKIPGLTQKMVAAIAKRCQGEQLNSTERSALFVAKEKMKEVQAEEELFSRVFGWVERAHSLPEEQAPEAAVVVVGKEGKPNGIAGPSLKVQRVARHANVMMLGGTPKRPVQKAWEKAKEAFKTGADMKPIAALVHEVGGSDPQFKPSADLQLAVWYSLRGDLKEAVEQTVKVYETYSGEIRANAANNLSDYYRTLYLRTRRQTASHIAKAIHYGHEALTCVTPARVVTVVEALATAGNLEDAEALLLQQLNANQDSEIATDIVSLLRSAPSEDMKKLFVYMDGKG